MIISYSIHISNWHPTPVNKIINSYWSIAHRLKKADKAMVYFYGKDIPKAEGKRSVKLLITLGKGQHGCDPDAYNKSLLDALVYCGLLKNDSKELVELQPVEFKRGEKATTIVLEEI
jgi:hypothetical protein